MKRDLDLIRRILFSVESGKETDYSGFPVEVVVYHRALIIEAGLGKGMISEGAYGMPNAVVIHRLTWEGHEYLDTIRADTVWEKTKNTFTSQGIAMTVELVKTVAIRVATDLLFR